MELPGQEDLMSIQYFGNGTADPTPDRYTPHCDGECDGRAHKVGARVATMVMYCDVPELGGATNFQTANGKSSRLSVIYDHLVVPLGFLTLYPYLSASLCETETRSSRILFLHGSGDWKPRRGVYVALGMSRTRWYKENCRPVDAGRCRRGQSLGLFRHEHAV